MEERIRCTIRQAMRDRITRVVEGPTSDADAAWIVSLLRELSDRLKALTPRRPDLHGELDFDDALVQQMVRHGAADAADLRPFADAIVRRLGMLCAPVQDESVRKLTVALAETASASQSLALLLCEGDKIVGDIECMLEAIVRKMEARRRRLRPNAGVA